MFLENRMCSLKVTLCKNSNVKSLCSVFQMETPLHIAAKKGDTAITQLLVDWQCNPHLKNCQVIHTINFDFICHRLKGLLCIVWYKIFAVCMILI